MSNEHIPTSSQSNLLGWLVLVVLPVVLGILGIIYYFMFRKDCPKCDGDGIIIREVPCSRCSGIKFLPCKAPWCEIGECENCGGDGKTGVLFWEEECTVCRGSGKCKECSGQGFIVCQQCGGTGKLKLRIQCDKCSGTGISQ